MNLTKRFGKDRKKFILRGNKMNKEIRDSHHTERDEVKLLHRNRRNVKEKCLRKRNKREKVVSEKDTKKGNTITRI